MSVGIRKLLKDVEVGAEWEVMVQQGEVMWFRKRFDEKSFSHYMTGKRCDVKRSQTKQSLASGFTSFPASRPLWCILHQTPAVQADRVSASLVSSFLFHFFLYPYPTSF
jgi:hypothetical protein